MGSVAGEKMYGDICFAAASRFCLPFYAIDGQTSKLNHVHAKCCGMRMQGIRMCASVPMQPARIRPLRSPPPRFYEFAPEDVESLKARHIRVLTEQIADEAMRQIRTGTATLADLASSLSMCEASKRNGGDLGWWEPGEKVPENIDQFGMCDELLGACVRTRPNALSKVHSEHGWHVYVVEDVRHKLRVQRQVVKPLPHQRRRGHDFPTPVPKSYHIASLGCQMNLADKERMAGELHRLGYSYVDDPFASSVFVLNTCSIREHAEAKVYSALGRHAMRKQLTPGEVTLCVSGCVAQQEGQKLLRVWFIICQ